MELHSPSADMLFDAILSLETQEECYAFFEDLLTIREFQDITQRFDVARALSAGRLYHEISKETGASSATVSRVNRCLQYGSGGYLRAIARLKCDESAQSPEEDAR